jgi:glycosyltransferase involved in cell wall biosynthesis
MIRVLLVSDKPDDGIAFYRSTMPWNDIQKDYEDISVTVKHPSEAFTWNLVTAHDVLFISNPRVQKHLDIIKVAKSYGIKVWSDYDDCYLDIPEDNESFHVLTAGHVVQNTKECLMESDITTVSTNALKEYFLPYSTRIKVVPNAFPIELLSDVSLGDTVLAQHNFISWRGSKSHKKNVREYAKEISEIKESNPEWGFNFFGFNPEFLECKYNHYDSIPLFDSFYRLKRFSSKIHIVTLYDRPFTKSKSNIAWIEATIAGSVVLAPDWEEWQKPGIVNYSSKEDFKVKLQSLINGEYDLSQLFENSREYLYNNLSLKKVNKDRLRILKELTSYKE